jgi:O-antigen/teichoic acid export membrane protein
MSDGPLETTASHVTSRGTVLAAATNLVAFLTGYAIHIVSARVLGPARYGRFVLVLAILLWVQRFQVGVLAKTYGKLVSEDRRNLRAVCGMLWRLSLPAGVGLALALALLAPLIAAATSDPELIALLAVGSLCVAVSGVTSGLRRTLQGLNRFDRDFLAMVVHSGSRTALIVAAVCAGLGALGAVAAHTLATLIGTIAAYLLLRGLVEPSMPATVKVRHRLLDVGVPSMLILVGFATLWSMDLWLVNALAASETVKGLYGAGFQLARVTHLATSALAFAVFPRLSSLLSAGELGAARGVFRQAQRVYLMAMAPTTLVLAFGGTPLIRFFLSETYSQAGMIFCPLLVAVALWGLTLLHAQVPMGANRAWQAAWALLPLVAASPVAMYAGFRLGGAVGTAWASLVLAAVAATVLFLLAWRHLRAVPRTASLLRIAAATGCVAVLCPFVLTGGWWLLGQMLGLLVVYAALLWLLREFNDDDRKALRAILAMLGGRKPGASRPADEPIPRR